MSNELKQSIFYIKYYATKHKCIIERKATLDDECFEGVHKKHGYAYKRYVDLDAMEEIDNGKTQYRTACVKWTINNERTLT